MICEKCHEEGKKSNVYEGISGITAMYCQPYYDEQGRRHNHDMNITTIQFRCSNNHEWSKQSSGSCWCGWGKPKN